MHAVCSTSRAPRPSDGIGLAGGFLADLVFADPPRRHPVAAFGAIAARAEAALYAPTRARGLLYTAVVVGLPAAATALAAGIDPSGHAPPGGFGQPGDVDRRAGLARLSVFGLVTWASLGGCSLRSVAGDLADQLDAGELDGARATLRSLCGRDAHALDAPAICRAGLESVAENTSDAVVGVLFWGAIAGPGGVAAYRAANTLDAMVGHRTDRYREFGWAAARLDDLLNWPAARLAAILAAICAPLVGGSAAASLGTVRRDGPKHPSPNAGRVEAAFAGALDVHLGGRLSYAGVDELRPVIGTGPAPTTTDLRRANRLSLAVGASAVVCCATARAVLAPRRPTAVRRRGARSPQRSDPTAGASRRADRPAKRGHS